MTLVGWLKSKPHLLLAAVGAGTNYEMIVKCYFGAGTDGTEIVNGEAVGKVYLNSLCNPDFSDVRFVSPDGVTVYSQKRVSYVASSYAIFIFKVTESLSVNEIITIWYGNPAAVDVSSDLAADGVLPGLVGAWNFDGIDLLTAAPVVADGSGAGNHGTLVGANNGAITGATRVAGGLSFDGVNDAVTIANSTALQLTTGLTISCFVSFDHVNVRQFIVAKNYIIYSLGVNANGCLVSYVDIAGLTSFNGTAVLAAGTTYHIACTYDGAAWKFYINGSLDSSTAQTGAITTSTAALTIGYGDGFVKSIIGKCREYNRALSATEVASLANNVRVDSGLVGEWLFEEASGATAYDTHLKTASGKYGDAMKGDGVSVYAAIPSVANLNLANKLTLAAWIYPYSTGQNGVGRIISKNDPADYGMMYNLAQISFITNAGSLGSSAANSVPLNQWSFVVITLDKDLASNQICLYVNGVLSGVSTRTTPLSATQSIVYIGDRSDHIVHFNGLIDETKIFNVALSSAQVTALYNSSPKAYANSPINYEDLLLVPGSIYVRKWVVAAQPVHSTWSPEVSWWGLSRLSSLVVLPVVNNLVEGGGCNVEVFVQDGATPILNVTSQTERALSLQGSIYIPLQTNAYLELNYLAPLRAMKGKAITLYSPDAQYDGEWLLRECPFHRTAEGSFTRYTFTLNLSQGDSINEL